MKTISLCMIVKNEEDVIARCLESVKDIVDEIIIVDTGSSDNTKKIVSLYTDKIYDFEWVDDFSKARNFSFSKATMDYIMWLDADDVILEKDRIKLKQLKSELDGNIDLYQMEYNYSLDKDGNPTLIQIRARLMKREKNYQWISPIHEVIVPTGKIEKVDIAITHKKQKIKDTTRNLKIFEKMISEGIALDDRQEYSYAKEFFCLQRYDEAIAEYEKYLKKYKDDYTRIRPFMYSAVLELSDCYKTKGNLQKALDTLLLIIKNEIPGSECCCRIGQIFMEKKKYDTAIYWFEQAIKNKKDVKQNGDANVDYNEFIPYIDLCVCWFWQGDKEKSYQYNEMAGRIKPNDETYLYNKKILGG